jgi:hypothetical protein
MKLWSAEHRAYTVETYFKNNDSVIVTQLIFHWHSNIHWNNSALVAILYYCGGETSEKQRLPQKENLQDDSLHLELLRTSNKCVRLSSEVLSDQQAEMTMH